MASAFDLPEDDFDRPDEPWFMQGYDDEPASEFERQRAFVNRMRRDAPGVIVFAVPNGGRQSDWQKVRRFNEGAIAGALDLVIVWNRGVFFAEFKDGRGKPSKAQIVMLNELYRQGHRCGVYRTAAKLIEHLREAGCPV